MVLLFLYNTNDTEKSNFYLFFIKKVQNGTYVCRGKAKRCKVKFRIFGLQECPYFRNTKMSIKEEE